MKQNNWKITLIPSSSQQDIIKPFNYVSASSENTTPSISSSQKKEDAQTTLTQKKEQQLELKQKKCWELAQSPMRSLFMNAFMLWMIGNQINIFPIIFTVMAFFNPIKAIFDVSQAFKTFDSEEGGKVSTFFPKIVYIFFQFVGLGMAIVKCYYLGLLPNQSDWAHTTPLHPTEYVVPLNSL